MSGEDTPPAEKGERIAKVMARAGLCSRREAEAWIAAGRVAVNGATLTTPATLIGPKDVVTVDGQPIAEPEPPRLWRYHKPAGLITSHKDPQGRPTVFERLPPEMPRVISVGRLDFNSEGLLLLTNDGELARRLELPATGWVRRYRARVHGTVDPTKFAALKNGVTIDGVAYGPIQVTLDRQQGSNAWVTVSLSEGKNREVRRIMEHLGYTVTRLLRVSYGPFQLGSLERGQVSEVPRRTLKDQLGQLLPPTKEQKDRERRKDERRKDGERKDEPRKSEGRKDEGRRDARRSDGGRRKDGGNRGADRRR